MPEEFDDDLNLLEFLEETGIEVEPTNDRKVPYWS